MPPTAVVVVDNNDEFGVVEDQIKRVFPAESNISIVRCCYPSKANPVPGIAHGDQTALEMFAESQYDIAVRWDDDLVPEMRCLERLVGLVSKGFPAAGGMYPGPGGRNPAYGHGLSGLDDKDQPTSGNGDPKYLQFFRWNGPQMFIPRHHLYSSFAYNVEDAQLVGGFCTDYSAHSHRADTDFTLRLNTLYQDRGKDNLIVDTAAIATHLFAGGGCRGIDQAERQSQLQHDLRLFEQRMGRFGIDPNY